MLGSTTIVVCFLALVVAKSPPSKNGPQDSPTEPHPIGGPPFNGGHPRKDGPADGIVGPYKQGRPHHGGPPPHGGHPHEDGPNGEYTYDPIARLAGAINFLTNEGNKEFGKFREFWMVESPTARAIDFHVSLLDFLKENEISECLPENSSSTLKEYMKMNAEAVNTCLAGWQLDATLQEEVEAMLKKLQELDDQVKTKTENCTADEACFEEFLESDLKKSIDDQLTDIREGTFVDARSRADTTSFAAAQYVNKCVMDSTKDLRLEIYNSNAVINACAAVYSLPPAHL